jgi:hypothetical protein
MDKDDNLQNGVRVQMDKLYLIVVKKSSEEVVGRESNPALEERREHHNLIHIGCGNILSGGGAPLQHDPIRKEEFTTSLWISSSSAPDIWKRWGWEAAIGDQKECEGAEW